LLDEVRSPSGVILWQFLRDAELWAATPDEARERLFAPGVRRRRRTRINALSSSSDLLVPLERIGRALDGRGHDPAEQMAMACSAISRWADEHRLPKTALAYAQGAALATPHDAGAAYTVGLLARRNAQYRRAESWFRRALGLGRRGNDWRHYGLACLGLGNLYRQRGDYPNAKTWYVRALRVARRRGLWDVRPMAMHDLFCVAANGGHRKEAEAWAKRAFLAYGPRSPRLVVLAHDIARFWLMQGRFDEAYRVFHAAVPHIQRIPDRRLLMANMARAAAGLNDRLVFGALWGETWRLVDEYEDGEGVAEALAILAEGAAALGDPDRAQVAATQALKTAKLRKENEHRFAAERVLESLRGIRRGVPAAVAKPKTEAEKEKQEKPEEEHHPELVEYLVEALTLSPGEMLLQ
jgi:tetratricopeptide (TPR) repeat protein